MPHWHTEHHGWIDEHGNTHQKPRNVRKAIVWPNDGKRGFFSRLKDVAHDEGPDMFVMGNPNRHPGAGDGPSRRRWTGHTDLEDDPNQRKLDKANFVEGNPKRVIPERYYDFADRKYHAERYNGMITDQILSPDGKVVASEKYPHPGWWTSHQHLGNHANMDPRNYGVDRKDRNHSVHGHHGVSNKGSATTEKEKLLEEYLRRVDKKKQDGRSRDAKNKETPAIHQLRKGSKKNAKLEGEREHELDAARHPENCKRDCFRKLHHVSLGYRSELRRCASAPVGREGQPKQVRWADRRRADPRFF